MANDLETTTDTWPSPEVKAKSFAQAKALRAQAKKGGLRFSAYLPPGLAEWLLGLVEKGVFLDPSEAVFVMLGQQKELEPHKDLRRELLNRMLQEAENDPRPSIPAEKFFKELKKMRPMPESAVWKHNSGDKKHHAKQLTKALLETADDMFAAGIMDEATHRDITQRYASAGVKKPRKAKQGRINRSRLNTPL